MVKQEWKRLLHNPLLIVVLAAIILIPSIYAGFFLASMWDPYGELDKLPVAVVNLDQPVEYNDTLLTVGDDLVEKLKEDASLDFRFVSQDEAEAGLRDGTYYMVITIPEDFSYNASTVTEDAPQKMQLQYETNPATNYVAMKLSESAMTKIQLSLNEKVSQTYAEALFEQLENISGSLMDASDGAQQLLDGEEELINGAAELNDGTGTLVEGASQLNSGSARLSSGAQDLAAGTSQLATGADALATGTTALSNGARDLSNGALALNNGINSLATNLPALTEGIASIETGAASLRDGVNAYTAGVGSAYEGANTLSAGLTTVAGSVGTLADNSSTIDTSLTQIAALAQGICDMGDPNVAQLAAALNQLSENYHIFNAGLAQLNEGMPTVTTGAQALATGLQTLDSQSTALNSGASALADGTSQINASVPALTQGINAISQGASTLSAGASDLAAGASGAASGASDLATGAATVNDGAAALATGAADLNNGTASMLNGTERLNDGMSELCDSLPELTGGTGELRDGLYDGAVEIDSTNTADVNAEMMAAPVELNETKITTVEDNGHAMAAYMMSVGLWVASLAFCLMYPLTKHDGITTGFAWWFGKASVIYPMAILQAVILVLILHVRLGFEPVRFGKTIAVACLASAAFMSIMYFFNVLLGKVGSFLMLIFMVLQLAGSAGTYPIEISGTLAQGLNRYMPFTYTVAAFRSTIGGGEPYTESVVVLSAILLVSTVLTVVLFAIRSKEEKEGKTNLYAFLESKGLA